MALGVHCFTKLDRPRRGRRLSSAGLQRGELGALVPEEQCLQAAASGESQLQQRKTTTTTAVGRMSGLGGQTGGQRRLRLPPGHWPEVSGARGFKKLSKTNLLFHH